MSQLRPTLCDVFLWHYTNPVRFFLLDLMTRYLTPAIKGISVHESNITVVFLGLLLTVEFMLIYAFYQNLYWESYVEVKGKNNGFGVCK